MSTTKKQVPVAPRLFTWPPSEEPQLIISKCKSCGTCFFPRVPTCHNPNCTNKEVEDALLSRRGRVTAYTIHYYQAPPPYVPPDPFVPYGICVAQFPEGIAVVGQTVDCDPQKELKVGIEVETVLGKLCEDEEGNEVIGWRFRPVK